MPGAPPLDGTAEESDSGGEGPGVSAAPLARTCPFNGLMPFSARDTAYFFGRERDREIVAANLIGARLTVLYGASGVGKSSLLRAGVARDLLELAERDREDQGAVEFVPVFFSDWRNEDVVAGIRQAVGEAVARLTANTPEPAVSLADDLAACANAVGGDILLILDQFEEYFLYHPRDLRDDGFDAQLASALSRSNLQANILISIREDALARLDRFKGTIPHLLDNYLRVRHLDRQAARGAIEKPIERFNADRDDGGHDMGIEHDLVEQILDDVRAGQVIVEGEGRGGAVAPDSQDDQIETPYLQLVMTRLWHEEVAAGSHVLRRATLERLGGAVQIVRAHLDDALAELTPPERELAAKSFHHLVTPSGMKVAHAPADLANYAGVDERQLVDLLERLSHGSARILRPVADETGHGGGLQYEIFHDVLAAPILAWRRRHIAEAQRLASDEQRREAETRARRERRKARIFRACAIASVILAVGTGLEWMRANRATDEARSRQLVAGAMATLQADPALSVQRAMSALELDKTSPEADEALRAARNASHLRAVLAGHSESVTSATYSRDGRHIVTASDDGTARLWTADGDQLGAPLSGHAGPVTTALFDDDAHRIVTAGIRGTVRVWDADDKTHRTSRILSPHAGRLYSGMVAFSGDGRYVVTPGPTGTYTASIWNAQTGKKLRTLRPPPGGSVTSVAISNASYAVATGYDDGYVDVWNIRNGKRLTALRDFGDYVTSIEFNNDDDRLLIGTPKAAFIVSALGDQAAVPFKYRFGPTSAHFSPDGTSIVTAGDDKADLWSASISKPTRRRGRPIRTFGGRQQFVNSARFSSDSKLVVTTDQAGSARLWTRGGALLSELRGHKDIIWDASFSPDGASVITAGADGTARVWHVDRHERVLQAHKDKVRATFADDGRLIVTGSYDGTARLWDTASGRRLRTVPGPGMARLGPLNSEAVSADGDLIVTGGQDGVVTVFDGFRRLSRIRKDGQVNDVALDHSAKRMIIAGQGNGVPGFAVIHSVTHDNEIELKDDTSQFMSAEFSPDGHRVVTANADKKARIFSAADGSLLQKLGQPARGQQRRTAHLGVVHSATWSADGRRVVTAGNDGTVRIWGASNGRLVKRLDGFDGPATAAVFGNHDQWIVAAGFDGSTRVWDVKTWRQLAVMHRHTEPIESVSISPTNNTILTAGADRTARLYRCEGCIPLDQLKHLVREDQRHMHGLAG
jgi:WD40 repeat protein